MQILRLRTTLGMLACMALLAGACADAREAALEEEPSEASADDLPTSGDPAQPGHRALDAGNAGERDRSVRAGCARLRAGAAGKDARARPARLGGYPKQLGQRALEAQRKGEWGLDPRLGLNGKVSTENAFFSVLTLIRLERK